MICDGVRCTGTWYPVSGGGVCLCADVSGIVQYFILSLYSIFETNNEGR